MTAKHSIRWTTWLAWSPLALLAGWHVSLPIICGDGPCIGKLGLPVINDLFAYSKLLMMALLVAILVAALLRKLTKLGWLGFAISFLPAMFHAMMFVD